MAGRRARGALGRRRALAALEGPIDAALFGYRFSIMLAFDRPLDVDFTVAWPKSCLRRLLVVGDGRAAGGKRVGGADDMALPLEKGAASSS